MASIVINQPCGIGDLIFCQKLQKGIALEHETFWPTKSEISYIGQYIKNEAFNKHLPENYKTLDLDNSHTVVGGSVLTSKYRMLGLSWGNWQEYVEFVRNREKEQELYTKIVGDLEDYVFLNNFVGTPPGHVKYNIPLKTNKHIVSLEILDGYTVFDWCKIIENASEIYTIDTSINYIIEFLNLKASRLECYSRFVPANFSHIEGLWKVKWEYKQWENI